MFQFILILSVVISVLFFDLHFTLKHIPMYLFCLPSTLYFKRVSPFCFSIFVAFVLEAFFVEYSVGKGDLQTSLERKIEELELAVAQ